MLLQTQIKARKENNAISSKLSRDCRNPERDMRHLQGLTCSSSIINNSAFL